MSVRAVVDVTNVEVNMEESPMICMPYIALWMDTGVLYQGYLPAANFEATALGKAGANDAIIAAAQSICEAQPYNIEFGAGDTVLLARGITT